MIQKMCLKSCQKWCPFLIHFQHIFEPIFPSDFGASFGTPPRRHFFNVFINIDSKGVPRGTPFLMPWSLQNQAFCMEDMQFLDFG